jgi:hypothetical protein
MTGVRVLFSMIISGLFPKPLPSHLNPIQELQKKQLPFVSCGGTIRFNVGKPPGVGVGLNDEASTVNCCGLLIPPGVLTRTL